MKKKNEFNYFDEFIKSANLTTVAIKELKQYVFNFNHEIADEEMKKIHALENEADNNLHELKKFLLRDFLPPIDREDIVAIAHRLDDLMDSLDEIVINMDIFMITEITENMKSLIELLETSVNKTYDLVVEMKNLKNVQAIKEKVIEVNKVEEQADKLYQAAIKNLYRDEKDAIQLVKWSNIYNIIEECFDACENIADCVEEVLLKNG